MKPIEIESGTSEFYEKSSFKKIFIIITLVILLCFLVLVSISIGAASVGPLDAFNVILSKVFPSYQLTTEITDLEKYIIFDIRLPRVIMALIAGIALASAGTVMQGVLRNPLVSPYTLGLSNGAAFGAALAIVLKVGVLGNLAGINGNYLIAANAFFFGLLTMALVYGISSIKGTAPETLILAGVAIGYLFSGLVSALKYISDVKELPEIVFWLMGGFMGSSWSVIFLIFPLMLLSLLLMLKYSWDLNVLSAGEDVANSLGVNVKRIKLTCLILASLVAASTVAFTGIIGFIGLVAPHVARIILGTDHRYLIPGSCLMGALILLLADTMARNIIAPTEIPVGILTSLIGAPFFLYLLLKRRKV